MKNLYSKALQYAVSGYSIIPLKKDKKPAITSWLDFQKEPATEEIIEGWWLSHPEANIGIITGKISGITVVDIDVKGDDKAVALSTFPETFTVATPSGGYHLYYQYDPEIKQTANTYPQFPHVDIRNDGGYVVAAGSKTSYLGKDGEKTGGEYKIFRKGEIMPFPRDLFLTEKATSKKKVSKTKLGQKLEQLRELKDGDGRNNAMCSLLGTMLRGQPKTHYPEVRDAFYAIAETVKNPLPRNELEAIWNSIGGRAFEEATMVDLMVNHKQEPYVNLENIKKILMEDPDFKNRVVFDTFLQTYLYRSGEGVAYEELHDTHEITITREISVKYSGFAMVAPDKVRMAIMEVARKHPVDAAADYVRGIEWDKVARLDKWLVNTYGVEENEYHRSVGSNWFKGMAKRMLVPGCKFDYVLVLEGPQGSKKSTSLGVLGGAWHVETTGSPDSKDFLMLLQGNLIIEFSEGETLSRGEIKQLKALITTQSDKFRAPYERHVQTHPRRCVFAMTTNQTEYLKDETGNRRWLPVATVGEANIEWLRTNRDQLFAEAAYRVEVLNETTHEFSDDVMLEQAKRQVSDPNEDRIVEWYVGLTDIQKNAGVTADMVNSGAFLHIGGKLTKKDQMDITGVLRGILKLEKKQVTVQGQRYMRWFPSGMAEEEMESMTTHEAKMAF
ncbi:MAG: bifunctional DNA primase/polymerase [Candidatus Pacebacteria bacterium]|nr:bifunctional DNA primase/polymerase [Candidatus Paceibacterota bacterium]